MEIDSHRVGVEGNQLLDVALAKRTLVVQRVDDRFKDRAFPRAGVADDREEAEVGKIERLFGAKATKAGQA